jgi:hypothetical protein
MLARFASRAEDAFRGGASMSDNNRGTAKG